jgi:hypothetical protein
MNIQTVSRHLNIRCDTLKKIDKACLLKTLPALDPAQLTDLEYDAFLTKHLLIWFF